MWCLMERIRVVLIWWSPIDLVAELDCPYFEIFLFCLDF
jgi:hypothetical protein